MLSSSSSWAWPPFPCICFPLSLVILTDLWEEDSMAVAGSVWILSLSLSLAPSHSSAGGGRVLVDYFHIPDLWYSSPSLGWVPSLAPPLAFHTTVPLCLHLLLEPKVWFMRCHRKREGQAAISSAFTQSSLCGQVFTTLCHCVCRAPIHKNVCVCHPVCSCANIQLEILKRHRRHVELAGCPQSMLQCLPTEPEAQKQPGPRPGAGRLWANRGLSWRSPTRCYPVVVGGGGPSRLSPAGSCWPPEKEGGNSESRREGRRAGSCP